MYLFFQIVVSALSVLGFYFLLKVISACLFSRGFVAAAVIVERKEQLESLDILMSEASSSVVFSKGRRVALVVSKELLDSCSESERNRITETADDFGAGIYIF